MRNIRNSGRKYFERSSTIVFKVGQEKNETIYFMLYVARIPFHSL